MNNNNRSVMAYVGNIVAGMALGLSFLAMLCACTPTKYVPVETVRVEYRDRDRLVYDENTISDKENIKESSEENTTITLNENGDTLRTDRIVRYIRDRTAEKENQRLLKIIDSLKSEHRDSVAVPYPVEKPLTKWQRTKVDYGGYAITTLICVALAVLWFVFRRVKSKLIN